MAEAVTPLPLKRAGVEQSTAIGSTVDTSRRYGDDYTMAELVVFKKVINSNRTIQSQQRGEPELSDSQKMVVLHSLLQDKSGSFLMRFGSLFDESDLTYIESVIKNNYEVLHHLKELRKQLEQSEKSRRKQIQNRRYLYLQHLMEKSSYFSEEEMRSRNPLLFEEYIGQYLTKEEKDNLDMGDRSDLTLSGIILKKMEIDVRRDLYSRQQESESSRLEERDSDSDDSEMESETGQDDDPVPIDSDQKFQFHQDYLRAMQMSFLNGDDKDFDYSKVDCCDALDSLDMIGRDAEDAYFEDEKPTVLSDFEPICDDDNDF